MPPSSIDDTYLGGELPEDPFHRGPIILQQKPLPRLPVAEDPSCADSEPPATPDLDSDDSVTLTPSPCPSPSRAGKELSICSSPGSDASFHTCTTPDSYRLLFVFGEEEKMKENIIIPMLEECHPVEEIRWGCRDIVSSHTEQSVDSYGEIPNVYEPRANINLPWPPRPSDVPPTITPSEAQTIRDVVGELSPLLLRAASVAYHHRLRTSICRCTTLVSTPDTLLTFTIPPASRHRSV